VLQTQYARVTVDQPVFTGGPAPLLTVPIATSAGTSLLIHVSFSASNQQNNQVGNFQLFIDGAPVQGAGVISAAGNSPNSGAIVHKATGLLAGAHTVQLMWSTNGGLLVRPQTTINEHAALLVEEVTV
jgi:hypothetical protein